LPLPSAYAPATLDTTRATLTRRAAEDGAVTPLAARDWAFADCRTDPYPGTPDPTRISLKGGLRPCLPVRAGLRGERPAGTRDRAGGDARRRLVLPARGPGRHRRGQPGEGEGGPRRRPGDLPGGQLRPDVPEPGVQRGRVRPRRLGRGQRPRGRPAAADQ